MCNLKKCCVNCKYYEHIRELDDEADWCHCPDHVGIISNDPEYVKSDISGSCIHYKAIGKEQKYDIGDRVRVKAVEGRSSYFEVLGKMGTIKKVIYDDFFGGPSYTYWVKVDKCTNKYQQEGLYVFNKDKSLTLVASTSRERIMKSELETKIMANAVYGIAKADSVCQEPDILNQYLDKKSSIYTIEREQAIQKINEASPVGKAIISFIAALKKAGLKDEMIPIFNMLWNDNCLTDTEKTAIKEINTAYNSAMKNIQDTVRQCEAILKNCQTFEQRIDVLQKYNIIDGNYKLKV